MRLELECPGEADTLAAGRRLAALLQPGDVILLGGALGAGKTLFTVGVAEGLGVEERVTSPSFVLVRRYDGLIPLVHADVYRLGSTAELEDLDLTDLDDGAVIVVEWGDAVRHRFGEDHLLIHFLVLGDDTRLVTFEPSGSWHRRPRAELAR